MVINYNKPNSGIVKLYVDGVRDRVLIGKTDVLCWVNKSNKIFYISNEVSRVFTEAELGFKFKKIAMTKEHIFILDSNNDIFFSSKSNYSGFVKVNITCVMDLICCGENTYFSRLDKERYEILDDVNGIMNRKMESSRYARAQSRANFNNSYYKYVENLVMDFTLT
jgi:hypothetical protein